MIKSLTCYFNVTKDCLMIDLKKEGDMISCKNCAHYWVHEKAMIEPCHIHPFYNRNKNGDCIDYRRKWYLFCVKK